MRRPLVMADEELTSPATDRRVRRRPLTPTAEFGLAGLAAAAIFALAVIAVTAAGGTAAMSGGNAWLPSWLRVAAVVVYAAVLVVHVWHMRATVARERAWHTAHVLMALGMIDMFAPTGQMIMPAEIGELVFAVAAVGTVAYAVYAVVRGERLGWLWPALGADLAAMAYMFVVPIPGFTWLTWILVGWLTLQAVGWVGGWLPAWADLGSPRTRSVAASACASSRRFVGVRVSLAAMNVGMAYMFLAMTLGMAPTPGMAPMPGMNGM